MQVGLGAGGYAYEYSDFTATPSGPSIACLNSSVFCGGGSTGTATQGYGAGIGVNLNQVAGSMGAPGTYTVPTSKSGIAYTLTSLPTPSARILIDNPAGNDYCAAITMASGMVPWSAFYPRCYNLPAGDAGAPLGSAPAGATHVEFQVNSGAAAGSFNFCVTSLSFY
jgi:hypothetical protein